jgi:heptosyltransferase I
MLPHPPQRVAILKPSALGDIAHSLPFLDRARRSWPEAHITWVVNRGFAGLLENHPQLDAVLPFDRGTFRGSVWGSARYAWQFLNTLRRERFDLVVDLQGLLRTGLMCAGSGTPVRVGFAAAREGARHFLTHTVHIPDAESLHAVDRYLRLADFLGLPPSPVRFVLPVAAHEADDVARLLTPYPRPWVAVALGAKWRTKRWPVPHFAETLTAANAGTAVLVGGPEDASLAAEFQAIYPGPTLDMIGKTSLPKLVAVLKAVDVMFSNDTGPMHVAVALGTKCVGPYTCTKITKHGPYGQFERAAETRVPCAGSYVRDCPHGLRCFEELQPSRMIPLLQTALT